MGRSVRHTFFSLSHLPPPALTEALRDRNSTCNNEDSNNPESDEPAPLQRANAVFFPQNSRRESEIETWDYEAETKTEKFEDDYEAETEAYDYDFEAEDDSSEADEKTNPTQFAEQVSTTTGDTDHEENQLQRSTTRIFRIVGSLVFGATLRNNRNGEGNKRDTTEEIDDDNDPDGQLSIEAKTF
jgi:hypothetical protein